MSLTSEIKDSKSPVRRFFSNFENKKGMKECLSFFQSTKPIRQLSFNILVARPFVVHSLIGTSVDYLIRYSAMGNKLIFKETVAHQGWCLGSCGSMNNFWDDSSLDERVTDLYEIGKMYMDGREATDDECVYSAVALSIVEKVYRAGSLPNLFMASPEDKNTQSLLKEYIEQMGGPALLEDISTCVKTFISALKDPASELFDGRIVVFNKAMGNSGLVGGADFDCVIEHNKTLILTEIKSMIKPLAIEHIRQIICYALLYDGEKDPFQFSDVGFYHSRSGSFRFLPMEFILEKCFHGLVSVDHARKEFLKEIS